MSLGKKYVWKFIERKGEKLKDVSVWVKWVLWKELGRENGGRVENCLVTKSRIGRLEVGKKYVQKTGKEHFGDLYNADTEKRVSYTKYVWF